MFVNPLTTIGTALAAIDAVFDGAAAADGGKTIEEKKSAIYFRVKCWKTARVNEIEKHGEYLLGRGLRDPNGAKKRTFRKARTHIAPRQPLLLDCF